jgi:hypothetical protein
VTSSYIKHHISVRATTPMLLHGIQHGSLMKREVALRLAAKELAEQRKQQQANATTAVAPFTGEITAHNARQVLIQRIQAASQRLRSQPMRKRHRLPPEAEVILPHTADPLASTSNGVEAAPVEPVVAIGIFVGRGSGAAELIDPETFHTSVSFGDRATNNWRNSIQANERIQQRRRGLWVG